MSNKIVEFLNSELVECYKNPVKKPFLHAFFMWLAFSDYLDWLITDAKQKIIFEYSDYLYKIDHLTYLKSYLLRNDIDENTINDFLSNSYGCSQKCAMDNGWLPEFTLETFQDLMKKLDIEETWTVQPLGN